MLTIQRREVNKLSLDLALGLKHWEVVWKEVPKDMCTQGGGRCICRDCNLDVNMCGRFCMNLLDVACFRKIVIKCERRQYHGKKVLKDDHG